MKTITTILFLFFVTTTFSQDSVVEYYNEIAGKSEYGDQSLEFVKWKSNVKIFFDFEKNDSIAIGHFHLTMMKFCQLSGR